MCGTQVPRIISRNSPPDALGGVFVFGLPVQFEKEITMSQPSNATGFVAFIPKQIDPSRDEKYGPLLTGFPLNLAYARARNSNAGSNLEPVIYWPDLSTYREDFDYREMCYSPIKSERLSRAGDARQG
jgi:hypothetical protein